MASKRSGYDWLREEANKDHWLHVTTMVGNTVEFKKLPAGTDLKVALIQALSKWAGDGWDVENFSSQSSSFFCKKDGERRFVHIRPTDPAQDRRVGYRP